MSGGTWERLVTEPLSGRLLDVGRTRYRPPTAMAEFVRARDRMCIVPNCSTPAHSCDLDHVVSYPGGPTSAFNLGPLCGPDHDVKTMGSFELRHLGGGTFEWTTPSGHIYRRDHHGRVTWVQPGAAETSATPPPPLKSRGSGPWSGALPRSGYHADVSTTQTAARQVKGRRTTVTLKIVMAVTGVVFLLFVLAHMYGNFKALSGQAAYDDYARYLRVLGEPILPYSGFLWIQRIGLIVSLVLHVWAATLLNRRKRAARTQKYVMKKNVTSTLSSRTMMWGGLALLLFIIFHILQFTTLTIEVGGSYDSPYQRLVAAFEVWWLLAIYVVSMVALGMHLRHGLWSAVQTLGWSNRNRQPAIKATALVIALIVVVGFLVPPLAIAFGLV